MEGFLQITSISLNKDILYVERLFKSLEPEGLLRWLRLFFFWVSDARVHKVSKPNSLAELRLNVLSNVGWKPRANEAVVELDLSLGSKLKTDQFMFV